MAKNVVKEIEYKRRAWELCRRGFDVRDIAYKLSTVEAPITTAKVKAWLDADLKEINELNRRDATEWREIELSRLDELYTTLRESLLQTIQDDYLGARAGIDLEDPIVFAGHKLKAIQIATNIVDKCAKISDSRAKLLGLYAPAKIETSGTVAVDGVNLAALTDEQLQLKFAEMFG